MRLVASNPVLNEEKFAVFENTGSERMTVQGAINKTLILFLFMLVPALFVWNSYDFTPGQPVGLHPLTWVGMIGGLIMAIVTTISPKSSPITAPIYAALEGLFLGGISGLVETMFPGIASQAIFLTMGVLLVMLGLYTGKIVKPTEKFKTGIFAAMGAVAFVYLISFVMSFFGGGLSPLHSSGILGIGISLVIIVIAALSLILDFDFIQKGAEKGAPKYMEWYGAFGLMVTLVWLYLEILRLLMKLASRD